MIGTGPVSGACIDVSAMLAMCTPAVRESYVRIIDRVNVIIDTLRSEGYIIANVHLGRLTVGETTKVGREFVGRLDYVIMGVSEAGVADLEIGVYDGNATVIAKDTCSDAMPIVMVRPPRTGKYTIDTRLHNIAQGYSAQGDHYFAYVIGYR